MPSSKNGKKKKFSIRKLIYNDKYLIVISVLAAVAIWVATSINLSPETTKTITVPVTVDFTGTLAEQLGIQYFDSTDVTVDVTVSCQRYLAKDITADSISATLRTDTVTSAGYQSVQILVSSRSEDDFTIESYYPTSVAGLYDVYQEQSFPLELDYTNTDFCADGYVVGETTLSSEEVVASGPRTYVSQISRVAASVSLDSGLTESQLVDLAPVAYNAEGRQLDYITFNDAVSANIPILKVETLSPHVDLVNAPADVASAASVTYSADRVQAGVLESNSQQYLDIGDIDFSEVSAGENEFTFDLTQLSGVVVLDGTQSITVTVTMPEDYESREIAVAASAVTVTAPDGFSARALSISPSRITVFGPASQLDELTSDSILVSCDLRSSADDAAIGTRDYDAAVSVSGASSCWVYGNYLATVRLTADE